jgi:S-DNA-T family DNA segregation ATPase FtsK/SpoIIIE
MRKKLEFQADRIEAVLSTHKVPARVTGGTVTPRWVRFQVLPAVGAKISKIKHLSEELAAALDATDCRVARRGAAVDVEIPRDNPSQVRLLPLVDQLEDIPPVAATLGLGEDGSPLLIRLPSPDVAHILVSGMTGSGKTVLLKDIVLSLAMKERPSQTQFIFIDPKLTFRAFDDLPHTVLPTQSATDKPYSIISALAKLMEQRHSITMDDAHIVLVIDELADLLMTAENVQAPLTRLLQRGRSSGIHVVAATQKPTASVLGSLIKANFPVRLVGKVGSATDARVASGWSGTGAERLQGQGDFIAVAEGRVLRFQAAYVSDDEIVNSVSVLSEKYNRSPGKLGRLFAQFAGEGVEETSDIEKAAKRLLAWEQWKERYDENGSYAWGFKTAACQFLWDRELAGRWDAKTSKALALAEETTTTNGQSTSTPPQSPSPASEAPVSSISEDQHQPGYYASVRATGELVTRNSTITEAWLILGSILSGAVGGFLLGVSL